MKKNRALIFLFLFSHILGLPGEVLALDQETTRQFAGSFLRHYDCHKQGRYTHEYHPYLLKKTAYSMDNLE